MHAAAQQVRSAGAHRPTEAKRRTTERRYVLSGLVNCGLCGRRMQGSWKHQRVHYRCRFPAEYALTAEVNHPRTVYLQEDPVVAALDRWLGRLFDRDHIDETCQLLGGVSEADASAAAKAEGARRRLADCDSRLAKYRAALDAGADPTIVVRWMREVEGERLSAERVLASTSGSAPLTPTRSRRSPVTSRT